MIPPVSAGQRVKIIRDNGRDGIVGFTGTVDFVTPSGAVVILDNDPAKKFRMYMLGGFDPPGKLVVVRRFFYFGNIERL